MTGMTVQAGNPTGVLLTGKVKTYIYLRGNLRTLRNRWGKKRQDEVDTRDGKGGDNERGRKRKDEVNISVTAD